MAKLDIALDLGTSYTSIFVSGNGIVLHEPSVIAYFDEGIRRRTRAVGNEAYYMMGKTPEKTKVVCPISEGSIRDPDAAADMLAEFINMIMPQSYMIKPKISCIVGVPVGITVEEREVYEDVLFRAGISDVTMVNSIILASIGADMPFATDFGGFITSIGGGSTEIATISLCGIVSGCSISIGGDMIDRAIMDAISGIFRLNVGRTAARRIKESICSLIRNDRASLTVSGIDVETRTIRSQTIYADMLYGTVYQDMDNREVYHDIVFGYYKNILDAMESVINKSTPSMAADIERNGIVIVGGGAQIPGLREVAEKQLRLKVRIPSDGKYATVQGGGRLLSDPDMLEEIVTHA